MRPARATVGTLSTAVPLDERIRMYRTLGIEDCASATTRPRRGYTEFYKLRRQMPNPPANDLSGTT